MSEPKIPGRKPIDRRSYFESVRRWQRISQQALGHLLDLGAEKGLAPLYWSISYTAPGVVGEVLSGSLEDADLRLADLDAWADALGLRTRREPRPDDVLQCVSVSGSIEVGGSRIDVVLKAEMLGPEPGAGES